MGVFGNYSRYYNLLYKDKDYQSEADFIHTLIQKHSSGAKNILNLGCGTGRHDFLLTEKDYQLVGVDMSEVMLEMARAFQVSTDNQNNPVFMQGDIRNFRTEQQFDVVTSLFHVMSYQTADLDFQAVLKTAKTHLKPGGIFVFDFWYGPAVLTDRPVVRTKRMEDADIKILRVAEPVLHPNENVVDVNYNVWVCDKSTDKVEDISETHNMRYWFMPEIRYFLKEAGFDLLESGEWMSGDRPGFDSWGVYVVVQG